MWPRGRPLPVYRPHLRRMTSDLRFRTPAVFGGALQHPGHPLVEHLQNRVPAAVVGSEVRTAPLMMRQESDARDTPHRHRHHPGARATPPLERHRPRPDRRVRGPCGRLGTDRRHSCGRTRRPHHPADPGRHADRPGPGASAGLRRRRAVRSPGPRRAADLQRRAQRTRHPGRSLGGLHRRLRVRRHGRGLADRRRPPPHRGASRQAPCGAPVRRRDGQQHHLCPRPRASWA